MAHWSATVEYDRTLPAERADLLLADGLLIAGTNDGHTAASFAVDADDLPRAAEAALRRVTALPAGLAPVGLHIRAAAGAGAGEPARAGADLIDAGAVRQLLGGISQPALVRLQQAAGFPAPVRRYGGGRGLWSRAAIVAYLAATRHHGGSG
jgi:hypothetical protein